MLNKRNFRHDDDDCTYAALKVLTAHVTEENLDGRRSEIDCLRRLRERYGDRTETMQNVQSLHRSFEVQSPHGTHLCLILPFLSTNLESFRLTSPTKKLPLYLVRHIALCVLCALDSTDKEQIVHSGEFPRTCLCTQTHVCNSREGVTAENVLFHCTFNFFIADFMEDVNPEVVGDVMINGSKHPLMRTQPLSHEYKWDDGYHNTQEYHRFCLAGFGSCTPFVEISSGSRTNCVLPFAT